jgi:hypothetical protein
MFANGQFMLLGARMKVGVAAVRKALPRISPCAPRRCHRCNAGVFWQRGYFIRACGDLPSVPARLEAHHIGLPTARPGACPFGCKDLWLGTSCCVDARRRAFRRTDLAATSCWKEFAGARG